jgi:hypothetical protein
MATPLYPLHVLTLPITSPLASFTVLYIASVVLAGVFMYAFVRVLGLKPLAAFVAGVAFMLSGFIVSQMNHLTVSSTAVWMPLEFLVVELSLQRGKLCYAALGGLALGCQILAGHHQVVLMALLALLTYGGWRSLLAPPSELCTRSGMGVRGAARRVLFTALVLGCITGIGVGLASFQLVPFVELLSFSGRASAVWSYEAATELSYPPHALINVLFPYFFRLAPAESALDWGWGFALHNEMYGYVGATSLVLAAIAISVQHARRRYAIGVALLALLFLILAFGHYTPLYRLIYALPGLHSGRVPARFLYVFGFYAALVAALGMQALQDSTSQRRLARGLVWGVVLSVPVIVGLVILAGVVLRAYQPLVLAYLRDTFLKLRDTVYVPPEQLYQYILAAVDIGRLEMAWPLASLGLSAAALVGWYRSTRPRLWLTALVVLVAINCLYGADFYVRLPLSQVESRLQATVSPIAALLHPDSLERVYSRWAPLGPNTMLPYHLAEAGGYTLATPIRLVDYYDQSLKELCQGRLMDLWGVHYLWYKQSDDVSTPHLLDEECHYHLAYTNGQYHIRVVVQLCK